MNNKITMPALVAMLALKSGLTKEKSEEFLKEFFKLISDTLREGDSVKIKALGTFKIMSVDTRKSVNVTNGEEIVIPGHKRIVFVPSREIAEEINSPFSMFDSVELHPEAEEEIMESLQLTETIQTTEPSQSGSINRASEQNDVEVIKTAEEPDEEGEVKEENKEVENKLNKLEENPPETKGIEEENTEAKIEERDETEETSAVEDHSKEIAHSDSSINSETKVEPTINTEMNSDQNDDNSSNIGSEIESETASDHTSDSETVIEEVSEKRGRGKIRFVMGFVCGLVLAMLLAAAGYFFFLRNTIQLKEPEKQEKKAAVDVPEIDSSLPVVDTSTNEIKEEVKDTVTNVETSNKEETVVADTQPSDKVVKDVIGPHNYLTTMAQRHYGDFNLWAYIYEENKSFLGHPDRIKPGTEVVVPPLSKYGVDPKNPEDVKKAKRLGVEIYKRFNKPERIKK